jgi:hypothetical protein
MRISASLSEIVDTRVVQARRRTYQVLHRLRGMATFDCTNIVSDDEGNRDVCGTKIEFDDSSHMQHQSCPNPKCGQVWKRTRNTQTGRAQYEPD